MPFVELSEACREAWRITRATTVPDRIGSARRDCQEELEQSLWTLAKAGPIVDGWSDAPFWIGAASHFCKAQNMESLLSDPNCSQGWRTPFDVVPTKDELYLTEWPGAMSAMLLATFSPHPWYPLAPRSNNFGSVLEWHLGHSGADNRFDQKKIDVAMQEAKHASAAWQAFWNNDAQRQSELPRIWLTAHKDRLNRFLRVVEKANATDLDREDFKQCLMIGKAAKAIHDLSRALANEASDMSLEGGNEDTLLLGRMAAVAAEMYPRILEADFATQEFWDSAGEMSRALTDAANLSGTAPPSASSTSADDPPQKPDGKQIPGINWSNDFCSVNWGPHAFDFGPRSAKALELLIKAKLRQHSVSKTALFDACGTQADEPRVRDLFRLAGGSAHPAWGTMIIEGDARGTYRIADAPAQPARSPTPKK